VISINRKCIASAALASSAGSSPENRAARGLAYSSQPSRTYDFLGGRVGVLFFVGAAWLAGRVRFAGGGLVAFARLATFRVSFFIVHVLEMPKGPERTPCAQWMYAVAGSSRESNSGFSAASSEALCFGPERLIGLSTAILRI
jgi:hypothetical protein